MPRDIKNIEDLRLDMIDGFKLVRDDPRRAVQVKEMANMAGKILNSAKLQIEYATLRKEIPDVDFLRVCKTQ